MREKLRKTVGWEGAREKESEGERCRSLHLFLLARWEQCRINQRPLDCIYLPLQGLRSLSPAFSGYNPWYDSTLPQPYNRRWSRAKNKGITRMIPHTNVCVCERACELVSVFLDIMLHHVGVVCTEDPSGTERRGEEGRGVGEMLLNQSV